MFEKNGLRIDIEANSKVINFLDVTLDLNTGIFKPFMKENDSLSYVNSRSNHPAAILKNIPLGVNKRLSKISANQSVFKTAAAPCQEALDQSGYKHQLEFQPPINNFQIKKKNRSRKVTWFNPPYSASVKSNLGNECLKWLDTAFTRSNPLHKLFTRQTVKVSYTCMSNIAKAVARHNAKILQANQQEEHQQPECNCRGGPASCPVEGRCQTDCVVYRATVTDTVSGKVERYTGVTGT